MSIVRAPRPDRGFTILDNDLIRDARLSFRARGVLAWILSQPDNWRTDADRLSREGLEGRDAIRSALKELRAAGYVVQTKQQDQRGRWVTVTMVYDKPQDVSAGQTGDAIPAVGVPDVGESDAIRSTTTEKHQEDEVECPTLRAGATTAPQDFQDWRTEDYRLFVQMLGGDKIVSDGTTWDEGSYAAKAFYQSFQDRKNFRHRGKKIDWPGKYLSHLGDSNGVSHWLDARGLEVGW